MSNQIYGMGVIIDVRTNEVVMSRVCESQKELQHSLVELFDIAEAINRTLGRNSWKCYRCFEEGLCPIDLAARRKMAMDVKEFSNNTMVLLNADTNDIISWRKIDSEEEYLEVAENYLDIIKIHKSGNFIDRWECRYCKDGKWYTIHHISKED